MSYLHQEFHIGPDHTVEVTLDRQANVMLLDNGHYQNYRHGRSFRYLGGLAKSSPIRLSPSQEGRWHLVIDLGGASGQIRHSVRVLR